MLEIMFVIGFLSYLIQNAATGIISAVNRELPPKAKLRMAEIDAARAAGVAPPARYRVRDYIGDWVSDALQQARDDRREREVRRRGDVDAPVQGGETSEAPTLETDPATAPTPRPVPATPPAPRPASGGEAPTPDTRPRPTPAPAPRPESAAKEDPQPGDSSQATTAAAQPAEQRPGLRLVPAPSVEPTTDNSTTGQDDRPAPTTEAGARPSHEGGTTMSTTASAETTNIAAARVFLEELSEHISDDLLNKVQLAKATLAGKNIDSETLGILARIEEQGTALASLCDEGVDHLNDYHGNMEQAVNSTPEAADTEFYQHS